MDALSVKSTCTLAYCHPCHLKKNALRTGTPVSPEEDEWGRPAAKRSRRRDGVAKATEVGQELYRGECGKHTLYDIGRLELQADHQNMLVKRRTVKKGRKNIAVNCWGCGGVL